MCDLKSGKGRCAYHLKESIRNLEQSHDKEVIKAAEDAGKLIPEVTVEELNPTDLNVESRKNEGFRDAQKDVFDKQSALSNEQQKYDFMLSYKDPNIVAKYLYESSEYYDKTKNDLEAVKTEYLDKVAITKTASSMVEMETFKEEKAKAKAKLEETREKLRKLEDDPKSRESQKTFARMFLAQDFQKASYADALYDASVDKNKEILELQSSLKAKYQKESDLILSENKKEKDKAGILARDALSSYRPGDPSSFRFTRGQLAGHYPEKIERLGNELKLAQQNLSQAKDVAMSRATKKLIVEKRAETKEFKDFMVSGWEQSPRGVDYAKKHHGLTKDYQKTMSFGTKLKAKIQEQKTAGIDTTALEVALAKNVAARTTNK